MGGLFFSIFNLHTAFVKNSNPDILGGVLILIMFVPVALLLRYEANRLLVKGLASFSQKTEAVKDLFRSNKDFSEFAEKSRKLSIAKKNTTS